MKTELYLSPEDILHLDEIAADTASAEHAYKVATAYFQNSMSRIEKERIKFWNDIAMRMGYNTLREAPIMKTTTQKGLVCAVVVKDPDNEEST